MKKLVYLFLTVLIVACSGSDDDGNSCDNNTKFVGSWLYDDGDEEEPSVYIFEFNADGTGSSTETFDGESYTDLFTWCTTSTQFTFTFSSDTGVGEYDFITNDILRLIDSEDGFTIILNRIVD
ncbi:MAG: hypothetical protein QMB21_02170 [Patiriisocius sp.]|jgi:hypothetical protein